MPLANTLTYTPNPWRMGAGLEVPRTEYLPVAASQTIYQYDIVSISSGACSQSIALPGSNNTLTASGGNLPILGIAMHAITTDSGDNFNQPGGFTQNPGLLQVAILDDNLELAFQLYNATLTNTPISTLTLYTAYEFGRLRGASATQWKYVITTTTTNGEFKYVEQWNSTDIPTTANYGWGWFRPILSSTVRQG